jgi:hypothetical protein
MAIMMFMGKMSPMPDVSAVLKPAKRTDARDGIMAMRAALLANPASQLPAGSPAHAQ